MHKGQDRVNIVEVYQLTPYHGYYYWPFQGSVSFVDLFCYLCLSLPYCDACFLQPSGHLLGKSWPLGFLVCDVFTCFVTFPFGVLGQAGVVLDCIDS